MSLGTLSEFSENLKSIPRYSFVTINCQNFFINLINKILNKAEIY